MTTSGKGMYGAGTMAIKKGCPPRCSTGPTFFIETLGACYRNRSNWIIMCGIHLATERLYVLQAGSQFTLLGSRFTIQALS